jgi:hypothetical protein
MDGMNFMTERQNNFSIFIKTKIMITAKQLLGVASVGLMLFTMYEQNETITNQKQEISNLRLSIDKKDSINAVQYSELFHAQIMNGAYELSLERLKEVQPAAAEEFIYFMEQETE